MSVCPIDSLPCEGANGSVNSPTCQHKCSRGKNFMDTVLGLKSLKPGKEAYVTLYKNEIKKKGTGAIRSWTHGSKTGWSKYKCQCEICQDAKIAYAAKVNAKRRKGRERKGWSHGASAWNKKLCKCDVCKEDYYRRYLGKRVKNGR